MAATAYTQWLDSIQIHVPDCPSPTITQAVRQACIDFCQSSLYLRANLDAFNTVIGDDEYELTAPADSVVAAVITVRCGGRIIDPVRQEDLDAEANYWRDLEGSPGRYLQPDESTIILNPVPSSIEEVRIMVALRPTQASGGVDSAIYERFQDAIMSGALARLMAMPGVAWSNTALADWHARAFNTAIAAASDKAARGLTNKKQLRSAARFL